MAPNDPKNSGGFFASLASSISNLGSAMTKSVNGLVGYEGLEVINPEGSTEDAAEEANRGRWKQEDRDGYWKMMQKYIGSDVTSMVTLPVIIFEPMTMLQKMAECDGEGEPLPGTELKEVWKLADVPKDDKYQYTHFAHKINSFDTAPKKLLPSDSRLRPDRYALEMGDMSKSGNEKSSLEERQRAEKRTREEKGQSFTPKWFDITEEVTPTPWGDLEVYQFNGKYSEHREAADSSEDNTDPKSIQFNPWQFQDLST
ncbi:hypothetical protein F2Q68_00018066 [Brassica cretica]|uniref:Oxysterol-binding protein n=1 Tax=Brassica cretica TaxID=69181 RepID=A0A8S9HJW1_BRACR|nr:hypothetical protein F2Q68_00018066 [Brassica cretica]